jgi:hypothetical protein
MQPLLEADLRRPARCGRTNFSETRQRGHPAGQQRMSGGLADGVDWFYLMSLIGVAKSPDVRHRV